MPERRRTRAQERVDEAAAICQATLDAIPDGQGLAWRRRIEAIFAEATLDVPEGTWMHGSRGRGGREGVHSEHLGHLLCEMQFLQRAYPGARW